MPRRTASNVAVINVAAQLAAQRVDSATFQAPAANTGVLQLLETGTAVIVAQLAAGEWITLMGLDNLDEFDIVSSVALGDVLIINPFLT